MQLEVLGPKPPLWRPFARRRWQRCFNAIFVLTVEEMDELIDEGFSEKIRELAKEKSPSLRIVK